MIWFVSLVFGTYSYLAVFDTWLFCCLVSLLFLTLEYCFGLHDCYYVGNVVVLDITVFDLCCLVVTFVVVYCCLNDGACFGVVDCWFVILQIECVTGLLFWLGICWLCFVVNIVCIIDYENTCSVWLIVLLLWFCFFSDESVCFEFALRFTICCCVDVDWFLFVVCVWFLLLCTDLLFVCLLWFGTVSVIVWFGLI